MPTYKDEKRGTWYCSFYYTDWQGKRQKKLKRGFAKQRDAKEYERAFLDKLQGTPQMTFESLTSLYLEDMRNRLRKSTMQVKENMIKSKLLPYWGKVQIASIKPAAIRQWQNAIISQGFSDTYLKVINNQLCAILNYAVAYYGLRENPCRKAGGMGKRYADDMLFWTKDEYLRFIHALDDRPQSHVAFQVLYWCGIRKGELLALTRLTSPISGSIARTLSRRRKPKKAIALFLCRISFAQSSRLILIWFTAKRQGRESSPSAIIFFMKRWRGAAKRAALKRFAFTISGIHTPRFLSSWDIPPN